MEKGLIVCSKAGSDKNSFLVVVGSDEKFVYLSDGKRYKIAKLKKKNLKHVAVTGKILERQEILTDKKLRRALAKYASNIK